VQTRINTLIEQNPTVVMSIASGSDYVVAHLRRPQTTIKNSNVPTLQIAGGQPVSPGSDTTLTITANEAPLQDTQIELNVSGSAAPGDGL